MSDIVLTKTPEVSSLVPQEIPETSLGDADLGEVTTPDEFFWAVHDTIAERYLSDERIKAIERDGHKVLPGVRYFHGYFSETPDGADEGKKLESVYVGAVAYGMTAIGTRAYELLAGKIGARQPLDERLTHLLSRAIDDERATHGAPAKKAKNERLARLEEEHTRIDPDKPWVRRLKSLGKRALTA